MVDGWGAGGEGADGAAVVGVLGDAEAVVGVFEAAGDGELDGGVPLIFNEGLVGGGDEFFVEVGEGIVGEGGGVLGDLVACGGGPLIPEAGAQDAEAGDLGEGADVSVFAIAVELVDVPQSSGDLTPPGLQFATETGRVALAELVGWSA